MSKRFITAGSANVDHIIPYAQETKSGIRLGGGAVFSAEGLRLWDDSVALAVYTGRDFDKWYGEWLRANDIDYSGVVAMTEHTRQVDIIYNKEGTFDTEDHYPDEYSNYADKIDRKLLEPLVGSETVGVHILGTTFPDIIGDISKMCREKNVKFGVEFEVFNRFGKSGNHELMKELASYTDYFSINYYEAERLYPGIRDYQDAIEELSSYNVPCFFRVGTDGAYYIYDSKVYYSPLISRFGNVDATGCGNSSTSATFWAMCTGHDPITSSYIGAVTGSLNAGSEGLISKLTPEIRSECISIVKEYV